MTRNNSETNLLSTDGVKNQAVIMKSILIFRSFCFEPSSLSVAHLILFHENDGLRFNCITMMTLLFDSFLRLIQSHQIINLNTLKILQVLRFDQEILLLFLIPLWLKQVDYAQWEQNRNLISSHIIPCVWKFELQKELFKRVVMISKLKQSL